MIPLPRILRKRPAVKPGAPSAPRVARISTSDANVIAALLTEEFESIRDIVDGNPALAAHAAVLERVIPAWKGADQIIIED